MWKKPPVNAGDARDVSSIPESGRSPGEEMATHSSILAWKIPWTEEPGSLQSMEPQSDTTECTHTPQKFILYALSAERLYQFFREKNQFFVLKTTPLLSRMYYFAIYTNIKSLHCTPETNIMLSVNYSSVKKKKGTFFPNTRFFISIRFYFPDFMTFQR